MWSNDKYRHQIMLSSVHQEFLTVPNSNVVTDPRELKKRFLLRKCRDNIRNNQPGVAADSLKSYVDNREPINDFASKPVLLQKMKDLHPQPINSPNLVLPSTWNLDQCQFQFPEKTVCDLVFHLPKLKANGFSSWTFDLITQSMKIDKSKKVSLLFTEVFNLLASGKARHKHLWISSRLLAISKDDPNSIRPIAIGEVFIRIVDKLIALYILGLVDVVSALYPSQCGVGVKGGSEVIAHSISIAYKHIAAVDFECSIISYDTKNAFNTISRKAILDSIIKHCPILAVYYLWLYGESSNLYDGHGKFICQSATGVRQGDPLGPLLFALGIAPILSDLKTQFPDLELFAFLDDIYKVGKTEQCEEAFLAMKQAFGDINLTLNIKKCKHLTKSAQSHAKFIPFLVDDTTELSFYSIPMVSDGISVLKVPIGSSNFITAATAELVNGYTRIVDFVDRLDPDDAFTLTKLCVNPCPNYLARCVEPTKWESQFKRFDGIIDSSIAEIAGVRRLTATEITLRHLPTDKGGLGISSYRHVAPLAWTASFYSSLPHIESRFPTVYDLVLENKDTYQGFDEKLASLANQKQLSAKANQIIFDNFLASFDVSKRHTKATFLSAASHGTSNFLHSKFTNVYTFIGLHHEDFREGIRKRLLMVPLSNPAHHVCHCRVGREEADCYHVFRCRKYQYFWEKRHDMVRDELYKLIKTVRPTAIVSKEQNLGMYKDPSSRHNQTELRCDIIVTDGTEKFIIDVAVTEPTCVAAMQKGSSNTPLVAADQKEKDKRYDYKRYLIPEMFEHFVPFALESTGRFGTSATKFVDRVCKLDKLDLAQSDVIRAARWRFLQSVSNILVTSNAIVARLSRHEEAAR
jgi:hypothetical protein